MAKSHATKKHFTRFSIQRSFVMAWADCKFPRSTKIRQRIVFLRCTQLFLKTVEGKFAVLGFWCCRQVVVIGWHANLARVVHTSSLHSQLCHFYLSLLSVVSFRAGLLHLLRYNCTDFAWNQMEASLKMLWIHSLSKDSCLTSQCDRDLSNRSFSSKISNFSSRIRYFPVFRFFGSLSSTSASRHLPIEGN